MVLITFAGLCDDAPLIRGDRGKVAPVDARHQARKAEASPLEDLIGGAYFQLELGVAGLVSEEPFRYCFSEGGFEVLYEILEVNLIAEVVAARVEAVEVDGM